MWPWDGLVLEVPLWALLNFNSLFSTAPCSAGSRWWCPCYSKLRRGSSYRNLFQIFPYFFIETPSQTNPLNAHNHSHYLVRSWAQDGFLNLNLLPLLLLLLFLNHSFELQAGESGELFLILPEAISWCPDAFTLMDLRPFSQTFPASSHVGYMYISFLWWYIAKITAHEVTKYGILSYTL